jgi:hypothetical protein
MHVAVALTRPKRRPVSEILGDTFRLRLGMFQYQLIERLLMGEPEREELICLPADGLHAHDSTKVVSACGRGSPIV